MNGGIGMEQYRKFVTFSYDDGIVQDKRLVDIFNKYGMKCTFNLNSGIMSPESCWEHKGIAVRRMTREEIGDMYNGHEIACHFKTHACPSELSEEELEDEIGQDIQSLSESFGCDILGGAYPYGVYNDTTVNILKKHGIKYFRTVETTGEFDVPEDMLRLKATCHHNDERLFEYAESFIAAKPEKPMVFYVWGHSYEFDGDGNWDRIERLCKLLAGCEDVFFGTNAQVLKATCNNF